MFFDFLFFAACKPDYNFDAGVLTISGSGVVSREDFENIIADRKLTSIQISGDITEISEAAFKDLTDLTSATIDCNIEILPKFLFLNCISLKTFKAPSKVTEIGVNSFRNCTSLTKFQYPDSVSVINLGAFLYCTNLIEVLRYSTDNPSTQDSYISSNAFAFCENLQHCYFPLNLINVSKNAFRNCYNLKSHTIPSTIKYIGEHAFESCETLAFVNLSDIIKINAYAFANCTGIKQVEIGDNAESIEQWAFRNCSSLSDFRSNIPAGIKYIGEGAFAHTSSLKSFTFPYSCSCVNQFVLMRSGITEVTILSTVKKIGYRAFSHCEMLSNVAFVDFGEGGVREIGDFAFEYCSNIIVVRFNDYLNSVGEGAFLACRKLETFYVTPNINKISSAVFSECNSIHNFTVNESNPNFALGPDGAIYDKELRTLVVYPTAAQVSDPRFPSSITAFGDAAFRGCTELDTIKVPDSVTSIGKACFENSSIEYFTLPSRFTAIPDYAFYSCKLLKKFTIESGSKMTSIGVRAFMRCSLLTDISLPDTVESIGTDGFKFCESLETINLGKVITIEQSAFEGCGKLKSVDLTSIKVLNTKVFSECSELETVVYGQGINKINEYAFYRCSALKTVEIPNGVKKLGQYSFAFCTTIQHIDVPQSVHEVESKVFYGCDRLKDVNFLGDLEELEDGIFGGCTSLQNISFASEIDQVSDELFDGNVTRLVSVTYCGTKRQAGTFLDPVKTNKNFHVYVGEYYAWDTFGGADVTVTSTCKTPATPTPTPEPHKKFKLKVWQIALILGFAAVLLVVVSVIVSVSVMKATGWRRKETLTESLLTQTI